MFNLLLKFNGSQHVSCANLFACIGILTNIGKNRPEFMGQVVTAIELLHSNLPPTLSTTQVNTIRKKLKSELSALIKHHAAYDYVENISTMLVDLGEFSLFLSYIQFSNKFYFRCSSARSSENGTQG